LDSWEEPYYLSRLWCIFEQHTAIKFNLPITIVQPRQSRENLLLEVNAGHAGIQRILACVGKINAKQAKASMKADEENIKRTIASTTGFWQIDGVVKSSMVKWVAMVVEDHMSNTILEGLPTSPPLAFELDLGNRQ
jgi:hypothetical protein